MRNIAVVPRINDSWESENHKIPLRALARCLVSLANLDNAGNSGAQADFIARLAALVPKPHAHLRTPIYWPRFLAREVGELRPWTPLTRGQQRFWQLLKRRSTLVRAKVQLRQSLADMDTLQDEVDSLLRHCVRMIAKLDRALLAQAKELGWGESIARCRAIPGIGPLTAMALVAIWHRGAFSNVDAFVAFLGLDVRVRQSGRWQGRRKLTKKGHGEIRRLLFNAAMQARRNALWAPYYLRLRNRGLSSTAAFLALSRKLAKVCFALLQNDSQFDPRAYRPACMST